MANVPAAPSPTEPVISNVRLSGDYLFVYWDEAYTDGTIKHQRAYNLMYGDENGQRTLYDEMLALQEHQGLGSD